MDETIKTPYQCITSASKGWVQYQPMGVIGIITPWNYPLLLSVGPLICALAAGNHAMIKISSASPNFGQVLENALSEAFPQELVAVVNGGGVISDAFSHLPFDKMIFTGSTSVGKQSWRLQLKTLCQSFLSWVVNPLRLYMLP